MKKSQLEWLNRAATGFVVIVTGVLVALAADGWNQSRQDRVLEKEYLGSLMSDLLEDSVGLAAQIDTTETLEGRASQVLEHITGNSPSDSWPEDLGPEAEWSLTSVYGPSAQLRPSSSTFEELESTGNLRLIRNRDLRRALYRYYTGVAFLRERLQYIQGVDRDPASMFMRTLGVADPLTFTAETLRAMSLRPEADDLLAGIIRYHSLRRVWFEGWQTDLSETLRTLRGR